MTTEDYRIRDILRRQTRAHLVEIVRRRESAYYELAEKCESPQERLLLAPLMFIRPRCLAPRYEGPLDLPQEARLYVQHPIAKYRADFAYIFKPHRQTFQIKLAIEVDGHEFHSSKEDRADDAARDRELAGEGFQVIRFTGSQVHQNPEGCAEQVEDTVDRMFQKRVFDAVHANHNSDDEDAA